MQQVKEYQEECGIASDLEIDGYKDFVFLNRFGMVFIYQSLDRPIERIIEAYNDYEIHRAIGERRKPEILPHFTCHSLRHTFCTRLCENETNIKSDTKCYGA